MTDITSTRIDDYAVVFGNGGMPSDNRNAISVEGAWLVQSLEDLVKSGEYAGVTMTAADAIVAVADLLRYLSQFALVRPIPMS